MNHLPGDDPLRLGGRAVGLCGLDGGLFQAKMLDEKYGLVGSITKVTTWMPTRDSRMMSEMTASIASPWTAPLS